MRISRPVFTIALFALVGATAIVGCTSSAPSSKTAGASKEAGASKAAGASSVQATTITSELEPGAVLDWILPIDTSGSNSVYNTSEFQELMFRPLYWTFNGSTPEVVPGMSLADAPVWSNGGKTATITMNSRYKWSDGKPVTAQNLLFAIDEIKAAVAESPTNWAGYVPGYFPADLVSATTKGQSTLVLNLRSPVNPTWFEEDILADVTPLPMAWAKDASDGPTLDFTNQANAEKIYNFLISQNKSLTAYATNPLWQIVDGPYHLTRFNAATGGFTMAPNARYGGPHVTPMSNYQVIPFVSRAAVFKALKAGTIDMGAIAQEDVNQIPQLRKIGYTVITKPVFGYFTVNYNFKDTTGNFDAVVRQLYFRQAMAHLEDEQGEIKTIFDGEATPAYGPIPASSGSPFLPANAAANPYPFSVAAAVSLLKAHGWTVNPGGTDVCARPGSGAGECGAGIPAGTLLSFNLLYNTSETIITEQVTDLAAEAKQAGIHIILQPSSFNSIATNYVDSVAPQNENKWAMVDFGGSTDMPYPTTFGMFNTNGTNQIGDYSNPTADKLISASVTGTNPEAVTAEAQFLTENQPALFQPTVDSIWAWKSSVVSGPEASWEILTQYHVTPEFWSLSAASGTS